MLITPFYNGQGLGNQLANYVTVRTLALDKGFDFGVMYPERFKGKDFLNLDMGKPVIGGEVPVEGQIPSKLPEGITSYYHETTSDYDPNLRLIEDNTMIHGGLQGVKYFEHRKDEIREWLKVFYPYGTRPDVCVINFRGGEYKYVTDFFLPREYWERAILMMKEINPWMQFEVHTDDVDEARRFFPEFPIIHSIHENWAAIRYAKYLILSNSSFAILPAWLNQDVKKVIAPWGFGRYNKGYWLLEQNYVEGWDWIRPL